MIVEEIETDRLRLLPLRVEHAEAMARVLGDPALHEFIGGEPVDADVLRARYRRWVAGSPDPEVIWANWVIEAEGEPVGTVQATIGRREAEVAWVVGTRWQGRGIATEAARALVAWLRDRGVGAIVAHVHPDNRGSAAVARAAGLGATDRLVDGEVEWRVDTR